MEVYGGARCIDDLPVGWTEDDAVKHFKVYSNIVDSWMEVKMLSASTELAVMIRLEVLVNAYEALDSMRGKVLQRCPARAEMVADMLRGATAASARARSVGGLLPNKAGRPVSTRSASVGRPSVRWSHAKARRSKPTPGGMLDDSRPSPTAGASTRVHPLEGSVNQPDTEELHRKFEKQLLYKTLGPVALWAY